MDNSEFCHLHVHDMFSVLDGYGTSEQYAKRAKELGFTHLALTNHGDVSGAIKFQQACESEGITPIIGCEAYIVPDMIVKEKDEKRYHVTLLVKNRVGWKNLLKMLTQANLQGFYYRPRLDSDLLLDNCEGLIVMSACASSILWMGGGQELMLKISQRTNVFCEIMPLLLQEQVNTNELAITFASENELSLAATNDCHYPLAEHNELQEVLLAMQRKTTWDNPERWKFSIDELYLKTADEMATSFNQVNDTFTSPINQKPKKGRMLDTVPINSAYIHPDIFNEAIRNTMGVAKLCDFRIEQKQPSLPTVYVPRYKELAEDDQLVSLTMDGLAKRAEGHDWIRDNIESYEERITEELSEIMPKFTRYFLVVWELINWCNENNIFCGPGRGSVSGSLVSYCLGITRVDPIKYKLIFSRFISPGRIDLPDIDMDFEDRRRDDVKKHLADTYGKWNVLEVSTFLKMHGRGAIRDVSRVFKVPMIDADKAAKCIVTRSGGDFRSDFTIEDAFNTFEDGIKFREKYPEVTRIAMAFEGQVKACGRHAAGVCVSEHDLRSGENANFAVRKGVNVCNWEKEDAEYMGLMKLDVLGLNSLTILSETASLVKDRHGIIINYDFIDLEDEKLYEQFTAGNTTGIFQFNSHGMIKLCKDIHGDCFNEVVAINALHRPGALRSGYTQIYRDRKFGISNINYVHPWIENITKDTQGLIIYQEQVMRLMYELGGLPWKTADTIRKVISKSKGVEAFMEFEQDFIDGCKRLGTLSENDAKTIFGELRNTGSYSFNLSHSVTYSLIAVWQMYLKVYYPVEFMASLLSFGPAAKKHELINETKRLGIKIILPDINYSEANIWVIGEDDSLLAPFREVKGIGEVAANEIVENRRVAGAFSSPEDLESRVPKRKVNKGVRDKLISILAYVPQEDKIDLPEEELERLSEFFDFELSNDPLYKYRKAIKKIGDKIHIMTLKESYNMGKDKNYFFGKMQSLRVGYREAVGQTKDSSSFGSLGGVYGNLQDETDFKMLIFGNKIYNEKKSIIEHCEGDVVLTHAKNSDDKAALQTQEAWFGDEILSGDIGELKLEFGEFQSPSLYPVIAGLNGNVVCHECELSGECRRPVNPSPGKMNIMIVGEYPGRAEDIENKMFVGEPSKIFWRMLRERGFEKDLFHTTTICKCYPKETKATKKHINACSHWLKKEIEIVRPFLILSIGNTGNYFFRGEDKGIMNINGITEFHNDYNSWVTYSISPAMVAYSSENMPLLEESLDEFAKKAMFLL